MLTAPKVDEKMEERWSRSQLQQAINDLTVLYNAIGKLPYSVMSREEPGFEEIRRLFGKAPERLAELASDDIPF